MRREVFVSYSQPDRDCAFELVARIEAHGIPVWIAPRDVAPAADWAAEIIDAIAASRVMLLILSAHSNDSPQVRREVERAVNRQVRILPFRIDDVLPSKSLEYFLSSQHWLDAFPPPREPHYVRLCATLDAILGAGAVASAATTGALAPLAADAGRRTAKLVALIDDGAVAEVTSRLAEHVGPVAKLLVRRAAPAATSVGDLARLVATEIGGEAARREFVASCARIESDRH